MRTDKRVPYFLVLPCVIVLLSIGLYPFIYGLWLSFYKWSIFKPAEGYTFIFLGNYLNFITDQHALTTVINTLTFTAGAVTFEFILGFGIALLVNSIKRGSDLITTALILPMAMTPILVGLIWKMLLDPTLGWIPYIFSLVGINLPPLLAIPQTALATVIFVDIWQWTPFMTLLLYAGLRSLPVEPFEAAQLDGASRRHTIQYIIIPGLMPIIAIALAFRVIDSMNFFDVMFIMTGGGPGTATESINYYAYKTGFSWGNMSYATAIAIVMLYVLVLISQVLFRIAKPQRRE